MRPSSSPIAPIAPKKTTHRNVHNAFPPLARLAWTKPYGLVVRSLPRLIKANSREGFAVLLQLLLEAQRVALRAHLPLVLPIMYGSKLMNWSISSASPSWSDHYELDYGPSRQGAHRGNLVPGYVISVEGGVVTTGFYAGVAIRRSGSGEAVLQSEARGRGSGVYS